MASTENIEIMPSEGIAGDGIEILESGDDIAFGTAGRATDVVTNPTSERRRREREFGERGERNTENERRDIHVEERDGAQHREGERNGGRVKRQGTAAGEICIGGNRNV